MEDLAVGLKKAKKTMTSATSKYLRIPQTKDSHHQEWDKISLEMTAVLKTATTTATATADKIITATATSSETTATDTEITGFNWEAPQVVAMRDTQTCKTHCFLIFLANGQRVEHRRHGRAGRLKCPTS